MIGQLSLEIFLFESVDDDDDAQTYDRSWLYGLIIEPPHDKTNKMTCAQRRQISLGIRPVWSESSLSAWRKLRSLATNWAHSKDSDQSGRMPRLIWVFAGRTVILFVLSWGGSIIASEAHLLMRLIKSFRRRSLRIIKGDGNSRMTEIQNYFVPKALLYLVLHNVSLSNISRTLLLNLIGPIMEIWPLQSRTYKVKSRLSQVRLNINIACNCGFQYIL